MLRDISNHYQPRTAGSTGKVTGSGSAGLNVIPKQRPQSLEKTQQFAKRRPHRDSAIDAIEANGNGTLLPDRPSYRFAEHFNEASDSLFPFVHRIHRRRCREKATSLLHEQAFPKNSVRKYSSVLKPSGFVSVAADPADALFANNDNTLPFGADEVASVPSSGICTLETRPSRLSYDTTSGSTGSGSGTKRSLDDSEILADVSSASSFNASTSSAGSVKRLRPQTFTQNFDLPKVAFGQPPSSLGYGQPRLLHNKSYLYDRIDNSMTISAKAILKMVDDSLVSSDTSIYSQSLASISQIGSNLRSTANKPVSITTEDLKLALL